MPAKTPKPYGTWPSPITPALAARASRRFGSVQSADGFVYWSEGRPEQQGRQTILRASAEASPAEVLPEPYSARSRVHEYGGGEFLAAGGNLYFVNDKDQDIYALQPGTAAEPQRITHAGRTRFADMVLDASRHRLIAVAEMHDGKGLPRNLLVAVARDGKRGAISELATGRDFYASPHLSPDGSQLAFLAWDLPDMPWDSAALYLAKLGSDGGLGRPRKIAGGDRTCVFQPEWAPDGTLTFVWDDTGWGSLYALRGDEVVRVHARPKADLSRPQWVFGARSYTHLADGRVAAVFLERGTPVLDIRPPTGGKASPARPPKGATSIDSPVTLANEFAALIGTTSAPPTIARVTDGALHPLGEAASGDMAAEMISTGEAVEFRRPDRKPIFAIYYAPKNPGYRGAKGSHPPAIIRAHGGPTSMVDATFKMGVQYYTSRGFAVLDVNYSGSTGYGRDYRERLDGQWGIADVADCAAAARYLATEGLADAGRIAIAGGSAGGYTVLMALATTDAFAAGSSHYGISDLALLMEHTHKFESGYLHRLLGTTPAKWREVCAARSPVNLIDGMKSPLVLFQGLEDKVVPPEQSRLIARELKKRGIDVELHEFAGEGHGFRKAETIIAVLDAELAFLQRALRLG
jgi:dipeptidyl aminopeptidase/acylaminoacyl peptidase